VEGERAAGAVSGETFTCRDRLLQHLLLPVRPAPLAAALKSLLRVRRRVRATPHGRFLVDPATIFALQLARGGVYEPALVRVLEERLPAGGTFVDLGANEGYFAVLGARRVGPTGRVVAVEPQARLAPLIRANLELNGVTWARVVEAAVAESAGTRPLFLTASTNTGASSFFRGTRYHLPTVEVRTLTLGALLEESGVEEVDLLKVDVEGAELSILEGARQLLASGRIRALTLDVHATTLAARELDPERPRRLLREAGYRVERGGGVDVWVRGA